MTEYNTMQDQHLGDWTCDCGRVESGYRSKCVSCGMHVTERKCEKWLSTVQSKFPAKNTKNTTRSEKKTIRRGHNTSTDKRQKRLAMRLTMQKSNGGVNLLSNLPFQSSNLFSSLFLCSFLLSVKSKIAKREKCIGPGW